LVKQDIITLGLHEIARNSSLHAEILLLDYGEDAAILFREKIRRLDGGPPFDKVGHDITEHHVLVNVKFGWRHLVIDDVLIIASESQELDRS